VLYLLLHSINLFSLGSDDSCFRFVISILALVLRVRTSLFLSSSLLLLLIRLDRNLQTESPSLEFFTLVLVERFLLVLLGFEIDEREPFASSGGLSEFTSDDSSSLYFAAFESCGEGFVRD